MDVWQNSIMRAALVTGLRRLSMNEVIAYEMQWRNLVGLPMKIRLKRGLAKIKRDPKTNRVIGIEKIEGAA